MGGPWEAYGRPMGGPWEAHGRPMGGLWGGPWGGLWEAYGKPLPADFLWRAQACHPFIRHVRFVACTAPNKYVALMQFTNSDWGRQFHQQFHNKSIFSYHIFVLFLDRIQLVGGGSPASPAFPKGACIDAARNY